MASFIDTLTYLRPINEEMIRYKKYGQFKAINNFKALKAGEVPRGGEPKE